ncbi:double-strand break repair protein AddB [bacterium]|nr:double-strand break repair protein AddB [bacterium]
MAAPGDKLLRLGFGTDAAQALAGWMWGLAEKTPELLAKQTLFIPSLRLKKPLQAALLALSGREALPLPRIIGLGELDDEMAVIDPALAALPPAIPAAQRRHLLARQIGAWLERRGQPAPPEHALHMAESMAELLDELGREGIALEKLEGLVKGDLAKHWQDSRDFLAIISQHWNAILADQGRVESTTRQWQAVEAYETAWRMEMPDAPVIIAGSTGSAPSTRKLMQAVMRLQQGYVVLPSLDPFMHAIEGELPASHPMCLLKRLLDMFGHKAADVPVIGDMPDFARDRAAVASALFWPAEATAPMPVHEMAAEAITLAEAPHEHGEARLVALLMREGLAEHPQGLTALVTPDRVLARRVSAELATHGILVDDGAAQPVLKMPEARFLRLVLAWLCSLRGDEGRVPEALMAMLKHPLAALGMPPAQCRQAAREIERHVLRQRASMQDWRSIMKLAASARLSSQAEGLLEKLDALAAPLLAMPKWQEAEQWFQSHIGLCETMAANDETSGPETLWGYEHGEQLRNTLHGFQHALALMGSISGGHYRAALEHHLGSATYRPVIQAHPNLLIIGPMEARLLSAERVIAAGMNEGTWPAALSPSPWLNRAMRNQLGLPPVEQRLGLAAHDIWRLMEMPEVIFTRARRTGRSPSLPSRWWERLAAISTQPGMKQSRLDKTAHYAHWMALMAPMPAHEPRPQPSPMPPLDARPDVIYATALELLRHHPYAFYAKYILKLRPLEEIGQEPGEGDYGSWLHEVMLGYDHVQQASTATPGVETLMALGREKLPHTKLTAEQAGMWLQRLGLMAPALVRADAARRAEAVRLFAECEGGILRQLNGRSITLKARADRLEAWQDSTLSVVDYKTGKIPTKSDIEKGRALQLAAEAVIAAEGGFTEAGAPSIREMWYWALKTHLADEQDGLVFTVDEDFLKNAAERINGWMEKFLANADSAFEAYPPQGSSYAPFVEDVYRQLAREDEWG